MTVTYCDVTGKPVPKATTNYTWATRAYRYDTLLDKDLSPEGMAALDELTQRMLANKPRFDFMEYKAIRRAALQQLVSRRRQEPVRRR